MSEATKRNRGKTIYYERYDAKVEVSYDYRAKFWQTSAVVVRTQVFEDDVGRSLVLYDPEHEELPYFSAETAEGSAVVLPTVVRVGGRYVHALFHEFEDDKNGKALTMLTRTTEMLMPPLKAGEAGGGGGRPVLSLSRTYPPKGRGGATLNQGSTLTLMVEFPVWYPLSPANYGDLEVHAAVFREPDAAGANGEKGAVDEELTEELRPFTKYYKRYADFQRLELVVIDPRPGYTYALVWKRPGAHELEHAYPGTLRRSAKGRGKQSGESARGKGPASEGGSKGGKDATAGSGGGGEQ